MPKCLWSQLSWVRFTKCFEQRVTISVPFLLIFLRVSGISPKCWEEIFIRFVSGYATTLGTTNNQQNVSRGAANRCNMSLRPLLRTVTTQSHRVDSCLIRHCRPDSPVVRHTSEICRHTVQTSSSGTRASRTLQHSDHSEWPLTTAIQNELECCASYCRPATDM